jgi:hypothetical protein
MMEVSMCQISPSRNGTCQPASIQNEVFMANFQLDPQSYQVIQAQPEHQDVFQIWPKFTL